MIRLDTLIAQFPGLEAGELSSWVERHWVMPDLDANQDEGGETWVFTEVDVARVQLIYDLRHDLNVAEEMVPLMLSLLDQVYDLRCALKAVNRAIAQQPRAVRDAVHAELAKYDIRQG